MIDLNHTEEIGCPPSAYGGRRSLKEIHSTEHCLTNTDMKSTANAMSGRCDRHRHGAWRRVSVAFCKSFSNPAPSKGSLHARSERRATVITRSVVLPALLGCCLGLSVSGCGNIVVDKTATVSPGTFVAWPAPVTFGSMLVGPTATAPVSLTNGGNSPITIPLLTATGPYSLVELSSLPIVLTGNGTLELTNKFAPLAAETQTGQLIVTGDAATGTQIINLSGTGAEAPLSRPPTVSLSPSVVNFGTHVPGYTSTPRVVSLTNTGGSALHLGPVALAGNNASVFTETTNCGATLAPAQVCAIQIAFTPIAAGSASASLQVTDNASNSPHTVSLVGTGSAAANITGYWTPPHRGTTNSLGTVSLPIGAAGPVRLLSPTLQGEGQPLICTDTSWNSAHDTLTITFSAAAATLNVTIHIQPTADGVSAEITADHPGITALNTGSWPDTLTVQPVAVPYYSGFVTYAPKLGQFLNAWWDWRTSNASQINGAIVVYAAKTDGTLNPVHELLRLAVSPDVDTVYPSAGNPPSPYMSTMGGRTVLDIWDVGFSTVQQGLTDLGDYRISNCIGIIHQWQYAGYDNALPEHYPANPDLGGQPGLQAAMAQGRADGCLMSVHENYVDYYPDYPGYNTAAIGLNSDGTRILSNLNPSTRIQSFAAKPSWLVLNAQTQSPLIHAAFQTSAAFLDVNSAVPPFWHADMDASVPQAAMLFTMLRNSTALWAYERQTHNGPVLGEGKEHWYYSGLLDGVEAQLGAGTISANSDVLLPLFVDFDLSRIHPLQVNHGMGYYSRWTRTATWNMTTLQMDAYRMQEIAFGHAPFLTVGSWNIVPLALLESNLVSPVALRYGLAHATSIQYSLGGLWVTPSVAAQAGQFTQVKISYDNRLLVVANDAATPLVWNTLTIPQYGWAATGPDLLAYTAQCGSTICDYAQTPVSIFANSRNQSDARIGWGEAAPSIAWVTPSGRREFRIGYKWRVYRAPGPQIKYEAFVHFVDDSEVTNSSDGAVFQGDHQPLTLTSLWQPGQTITDGPWSVQLPDSVPDGTYSIRVGLYDPATGNRLLLSGDNDGTGRYIVGQLIVSGAGTQFDLLSPSGVANDPRLNAADSVVNFGPVQTDGMVTIIKDSGLWILRPYPRYRNFTVLLNSATFPVPSSVQASGAFNAVVVPQIRGDYWLLPLDGNKQYSWPIQ
jgi:hypothetical protein